MTRPPGMIVLTLPCICPEPGCGMYLQAVEQTRPGVGVNPHYALMHPRVAVPRVEVTPGAG